MIGSSNKSNDCVLRYAYGGQASRKKKGMIRFQGPFLRGTIWIRKNIWPVYKNGKCQQQLQQQFPGKHRRDWKRASCWCEVDFIPHLLFSAQYISAMYQILLLKVQYFFFFLQVNAMMVLNIHQGSVTTFAATTEDGLNFIPDIHPENGKCSWESLPPRSWEKSHKWRVPLEVQRIVDLSGDDKWLQIIIL